MRLVPHCRAGIAGASVILSALLWRGHGKLQDHLKERLTGAAILVAVVVLLVPEMFRGRPAPGFERGGDSADGLPHRTYTIDLRDPPAAQPPAVVAPPVTAPQGASREPLVAALTPSPAPATEPTRARVPASSAAPAHAHAVPSGPATHARASIAGWTVQVGSFTRRDFAEHMVKQVRAKGFTVEVAGPDDHGLYRVRSAPNPEHAAALALKLKMQGTGLKPIVIAMP